MTNALTNTLTNMVITNALSTDTVAATNAGAIRTPLTSAFSANMVKGSLAIQKWLTSLGISEEMSGVLLKVGWVLLIVLLCLIADFIAKHILISFAKKIAARTKTQWDDIILKRGVLNRLAHIAPAIVVYFLLPAAFPEFPGATAVLTRLALAYMLGVTMFVIDSLLSAGLDIYNTFDFAKNRPIKGYVQLVKIFVFIVGGILIITTILNKSALGVLGGISAMTAVLLLVFKDTILGLVASVQINANNMVNIGDWIEVSQYGADGDVMDITLQNVVVQNFDKTIVTVPITALVTGAFRNWRGMTESGGRRIKRALAVDMQSVCFCTKEMIERFKKFEYVKEYIEEKVKDIDEFNAKKNCDLTISVNGRRLTNLGTFRAYITNYLKNHPLIHTEGMTFLVRHLAPTEKGLPLEIYVFSKDQVWANYEGIQADIFDHLLAVLPEFGLRVYQAPSGYDLERLGQNALAGTQLK